jgi:hypothetical protein
MLLAFSISVISCGFLLTLIGDTKKGVLLQVDKSSTLLPIPRCIIRNISMVLHRFLPEGYITRQYELYSELSCEPDKLFDYQIRKILTLLIVTTPLFIILLYFSGYAVYWTIPAEMILYILVHHEIRQKVQKRREALMDEIPLFLSMLVTLMQSGVLLPKAIETCSEAFPDTSTLGNEIQIMKAQMLSGMSAGCSIESFSGRTSIPEAQAALLLASRYELTGGSEVLQLLSLQSTACWSLCRNASRKKRERDALAMILPMTLDLISVLLVAITPALLSLNIT